MIERQSHGQGDSPAFSATDAQRSNEALRTTVLTSIVVMIYLRFTYPFRLSQVSTVVLPILIVAALYVRHDVDPFVTPFPDDSPFADRESKCRHSNPA